MKYIRTKDDIQAFDDGCDLRYIYLAIGGIKIADTIEELFSRVVLSSCDFIILNKERTQYRFEGSDEWFDIIDTELRMGIYGAIWTDKGLIYVAKMNDNKEFELLCKD